MKSILLHVYNDTGFETRLQAALDLARAFEGHITCIHATPLEDYLAIDPWVAARLPEEFSDKMKALRQELQANVEERLRREGASWDWIHVNELMSTALIRYSILSDVIVLTVAGQAFERDEPRPIAAAVATGARSAVLAVPTDAKPLNFDAPMVVAWNGSPEAAAATRAAVPLLKRAPEVFLLEIEEKATAYPRDLAAHYLSRHGVRVQIVQRSRSHESTSDTIRSNALELGAGLLVMGAYGHSRLREALLGGVTRRLVADSPIPLLLSH